MMAVRASTNARDMSRDIDSRDIDLLRKNDIASAAAVRSLALHDQALLDSAIPLARFEFMSYFATAKECWFSTTSLLFCYVCGLAAGDSRHPGRDSNPPFAAGQVGPGHRRHYQKVNSIKAVCAPWGEAAGSGRLEPGYGTYQKC
jgi:hypothetical protein